MEDLTNDRVLRLNVNAHPLSYINDHDIGTTWLSKIMMTHELDEGITITVDLANGQYQVNYPIIHTCKPRMFMLIPQFSTVLRLRKKERKRRIER